MGGNGFSTMWDELRPWQGLLGSLVGSSFGFLALIAGALFNFWLNRRRDAALRRDEALAVAAALYGEMLLLREEVARIARSVSNEESRWGPGERYGPNFFLENQISEPTLYKALSAKIGLLSAELNLGITRFHQKVQETRVWLPRMKEDESRPYSYSALYVLEPAWAVVEGVVPTLRAIERDIGITKPAADPNLGLTDVVMEGLRVEFESHD